AVCPARGRVRTQGARGIAEPQARRDRRDRAGVDRYHRHAALAAARSDYRAPDPVRGDYHDLPARRGPARLSAVVLAKRSASRDPITTGVCCAKAVAPAWRNNTHWWLWVPAPCAQLRTRRGRLVVRVS